MPELAKERFAQMPFQTLGFIVSPDHPRAAVCAPEVVVVYDTDRREPVCELVIPEGLAAVSFSWDARRLIVAGRDRSLRMYELADHARLVWSVERVHDDALFAVAVSHDGTLIATGSEDRKIRLWDAATGAPRGRLLGHEYPVQALAIDEDGLHLASSDSVTLRLWDIAAADEPFALRGHVDGVGGLAIAPDGGVLVSMAHDIRLWDTRSLQSLGAAPSRSQHGWNALRVLLC